MTYNGKQASENVRTELSERVAKLRKIPTLAIISVAEHPSTLSFIKIKRNYAEKIGITIKEFNFPEEKDESALVATVIKLGESKEYDGIIVQLPLPLSYDTEKVLNTIPKELDVDVLGAEAIKSFEQTGTPVPPVAGAVAHILKDTHTELNDKNVVIIGRGKLVGTPVATWIAHQGITPHVVDVTTSEAVKLELYKEADVVISGIGAPRLLKPDYFKQGVVLIDAGTSEQGGVLSGDCDPLCADIANVFTPVPGGVGPLTIAHLFHNVITFVEKRVK